MSMQNQTRIFVLASSPASATDEDVDTELSMSMHTPSGCGKEAWPHRKPKEDQNDWIVTQTRRTVDTLRRGSPFFEQNPPRCLPGFQDTELDLGQVIGNGEFGMVLEVHGFKLVTSALSQESALRANPTVADAVNLGYDEFPTALNNDDARMYMRDTAIREGASRFAVKVRLLEFLFCSFLCMIEILLFRSLMQHVVV